MNTDGNNFQVPQIVNPGVSTIQHQPTSMNSVSISSLPTLSPATIVRAVFPSDQHHLQRLQHPQSTDNVIGPTYVFPSQQFHRQNVAIVDSTSTNLASPHEQISLVSTIGAAPPRGKTQPKQQQPRQRSAPKKSTKKPTNAESQQQSPSKTGQSSTQGVRLSKKQQEKEDYYNRKHHLLRKCIRSLVFKNAALCDEVARLHQRIVTVDEERKTLVKRLLHHERLKLRRQQTAEHKKAQQAAAAAASLAASLSPTLTTAAAAQPQPYDVPVGVETIMLSGDIGQ